MPFDTRETQRGHFTEKQNSGKRLNSKVLAR